MVQLPGSDVLSFNSKTHALMAPVVFGGAVPFRNFAGLLSMSSKNWYESKSPTIKACAQMSPLLQLTRRTHQRARRAAFAQEAPTAPSTARYQR